MSKLEIELFRIRKLRTMLLSAFLCADAELLKLSLKRDKELEVKAAKKLREQNAFKKREKKLKTIQMNMKKWRLSKPTKSISEVKKRTAKAEKPWELKVRGFEGKRYYH